MNGYLPARLLQIVGLIGLIGAVVFWAITDRQSTLIVSSFMSLILLGAYKGAIDTLKSKVLPPSDKKKEQ